VIKESDIAALSEPPAQTPEKKSPQTAEQKAPAPLVEKKPSQPPEKKLSQSPPQHAASMHLVNQAKASLAQGKVDPAIPLLEQAIQVDVHNGEAFFNLAKAWRMKGSRQKALQFAQKAEVLYQNDPAKLKQVYLLEADLNKEMGNIAKSDAYRQKASKLK
jgi:tetratricopeptide (TPR) repeat protein